MILVSEELGGLGYFFQCLVCFCGVLFVSAVSQLVMICAGAVYKSCKEINTRITRMLSVFPLPPKPSVDALSLWSLSGLYQFHFINSFLLQTLLRCRTKVKMKMRARVTRHDEGPSDEASKGRKQEQEHQNETNLWNFIVRVQTQENNKSWFSPLYGDLAAKLPNKC